MPSFDTVNYAVRPNKAIERKIAFSSLAKISRILDLSTYRYVGLGSIWFVDFIMAHKILGIGSMISIEQSDIGCARAEFNRPFSCVSIMPGETTKLIPTLGLQDRPSLVWLDYDTSIDGPVIPDIALLAGRCAPNTVLMVTVNANKNLLPKEDENHAPIDEETSLRRIAGDMVPNPLSPKSLHRRNYPKLICEILGNQFYNSTVRSGRDEAFIKLFDLVYVDGPPMVTVGGIVVAADKAGAIRELVASEQWEGIVPEVIAVPPLTIKEKLALDRMLPSSAPPTDAEMAAAGFRLEREQIDTYYRHYRDYPMFGEIQL